MMMATMITMAKMIMRMATWTVDNDDDYNDGFLSKVLKPDGVQAVGCGQHHTLVATQVSVIIIIN